MASSSSHHMPGLEASRSGFMTGVVPSRNPLVSHGRIGRSERFSERRTLPRTVNDGALSTHEYVPPYWAYCMCNK